MKKMFFLASAAVLAAVLFAACDPADNKTETPDPPKVKEPFPIQVDRAAIDTTIEATKALSVKFRFKCYDVEKLEMELGTNYGMAPTVELNRSNMTVSIYDLKRYSSQAYITLRLYDDISEKKLRLDVHEKR
ncbi:MAG: hypothetical protein K6G86_07990 [Bacteroidales bacterium]|nr:hypothetical protein [Bacteroidales bacterium]